MKERKVDDRPKWFTPEVLRAARVFVKEVSSGQYTNEGHTKVEKPAFVYYPLVISNFPDEPGKGRFVHLVSLGLQLAQVVWMSTRQLPFYVLCQRSTPSCPGRGPSRSVCNSNYY